MDAGEEVEIGTACKPETEALLRYTFSAIDHYKSTHPSEIPDKKQKFFNTKMPYFQNF